MAHNSAILVAITCSALMCGGCRPGPHRVAEEHREQPDKTSPAYKAGEAAHDITKGMERAAKAAGRKLDEGARKAREGWKEKEREDRERARDRP